MTWDDHNNAFEHKEESLEVKAGIFYFWIDPFMVCYLYVWMASTSMTMAVTCTSAVDKWFTMYPSVFIVVLIHLFPFFAFIVTIQLTLLLEYQVWGLMKVVYKFHLKCLQKVFRKFLFWCLGWFSLKSLEVLYVTHLFYINEALLTRRWSHLEDVSVTDIIVWYYIICLKTTFFQCSKSNGSSTRVTRLKVSPNMADPISLKENRSLPQWSKSPKGTLWNVAIDKNVQTAYN